METKTDQIPIKLVASLAQSVEHKTFNLRAAGSSPAGGFAVMSDHKTDKIQGNTQLTFHTAFLAFVTNVACKRVYGGVV